MARNNFNLRLTNEAAEVLKQISRGEKSNYICAAIIAYSRGRAKADLTEISRSLLALPSMVDELKKISSKMDNVSLVSGSSDPKPKEKPEKKASRKKIDTSNLTKKYLHM